MRYSVAVVTGASSGIGRAIALQLCNAGTKVYGLARDAQKLKETKQSLPNAKRKLFVPVACDISSKRSAQKILHKVFEGRDVDLVVNNAGIGFSRDFPSYKNAEIDAVIATNLRGVITVTQAALAARRDSHHLQIVNVTSLAGKMGFPQLSIYSATKFAIEGLTEALRHEYQDKNASFTVLRPGITDTAFFGKAGMELYKKGVENLKSHYSPEKVASIFLSKLDKNRKTIVVGNDKIFIALLPFIPFSGRFKVLNITNKL